MQYKKFFWGFVIVNIIVLCAIFIITTFMDPLGILKSPVVQGINNYKVKQEHYLDIWKPYDVVENNCKVVYMGSSRVLLGIEPTASGYADTDVYNFSFSGLSLKHTEKYLQSLYKVHIPKRIYLGLDFFQFSKGSFNENRTGFSEDRLAVISKSSNEIFAEKLKDNFQLYTALKVTFKESFQNNDKTTDFIRGWHRVYAEDKTNAKAYYGTINQYVETFKRWEYEEKSVECLKRIVSEARKHGIEVICFFNPISIDLHVLIELSGHTNDLNMVKNKVVNVVGEVYDFNFVNQYTMDRGLYRDPSHYLGVYGKLIKNDIHNGVNNERLFILNNSNLNIYLNEENKRLGIWLEKNDKYISVLKKYIFNGRRFILGDLKSYIGF